MTSFRPDLGKFICMRDLGAPAPAPCVALVMRTLELLEVAWWKSISLELVFKYAGTWNINSCLPYSHIKSEFSRFQQYWLKFHAKDRSSKYHLLSARTYRRFGPFTHSRILCRPWLKIDTLDSDSPALNQSTQAMSKVTSHLGPDSSNKTACLEIHGPKGFMA